MLITPAYAQATGGGDTSSMMVQLAPLALIFVVFYFFLIRPQQTKAKQQRAMLDAVRRGDRIVTGGGLIGMRERARVYGGDVQAGPRQTGGWKVSARLLLDAGDAS